ncbi:MAG TPA: hypothetical protein VF482_10095 [Trebonia sp.]
MPALLPTAVALIPRYRRLAVRRPDGARVWACGGGGGQGLARERAEQLRWRMTGQEEQLLIEFSSARLPRQDLSLLWGLVVDAAAEQLADEISIEDEQKARTYPWT